MAFKGVVTIGSRMRISFRADQGNQESSALVTGFVPDGTHATPHPLFDMVAAGGTADQNTQIVRAFAIKIAVDVPDGGSGQLEVFVDGQLRDSDVVGDTVWTYGIV